METRDKKDIESKQGECQFASVSRTDAEATQIADRWIFIAWQMYRGNSQTTQGPRPQSLDHLSLFKLHSMHLSGNMEK